MKSLFQQAAANDILFIDSSHIIRPQSDVLYEFQELLPSLKEGVIIHVYDMFTQKDYLDDWIYKYHFFWNEQYIMEAFLAYKSEFRILAALNYLTHNYRKELAEKCPVFSSQHGREPGSMWLKRN